MSPEVLQHRLPVQKAPLSLPHTLRHSLTPSLPHSLTPSLLTPSLPHSLTPSLPHSLTPSLPHSLSPLSLSLPLLCIPSFEESLDSFSGPTNTIPISTSSTTSLILVNHISILPLPLPLPLPLFLFLLFLLSCDTVRSSVRLLLFGGEGGERGDKQGEELRRCVSLSLSHCWTRWFGGRTLKVK